MTLVEVTIAGAIVLVVVLVASGLFLASDRAYRSEVPLRGRQVRCQQIVDEIARDLHEGGKTNCWLVDTIGETLPAGVDAPKTLVLLSARDDAGNFIVDPSSLAPIWQRTLAYVPLNAENGQAVLSRIDFGSGSVPSPLTGRVPRITASPSTLRLEWLSGGSPVTPPGIVDRPRNLAVLRLPSLERFRMSNPFQTAGTQDDYALGGGGTWAADVWNVGVSIRLGFDGGRSTRVDLDTTIQGRN
jgi:hypothetical protein